MAKLTAFVALFIALMALTSASATTTVVTTTVVDDEKINPQQSCQREIEQLRMRHCIQWMQTGMGRPYEPSFLRSAVANPKYQEEHLEECCDELRSVSSPCRCDAIRRMMMDMQQQYGTEEEMQQMMKQKAQSLPRKCNMRSPSECRFTAVFF